MYIQFIDEVSGDDLFALCPKLLRIPVESETIFLSNVEYKVEKVETYLDDEGETNPVSGQESVWALSQETYKVYLSEV